MSSLVGIPALKVVLNRLRKICLKGGGKKEGGGVEKSAQGTPKDRLV